MRSAERAEKLSKQIRDEGGEARGRPCGAAGERLEGEHDQRVAGEERHRLAVGDVDRGLLAPHRRVVEAGQVVVDERGAVQELDRRRRGTGVIRKDLLSLRRGFLLHSRNGHVHEREPDRQQPVSRQCSESVPYHPPENPSWRKCLCC